MASRVRTIEWKAGRVVMIDQRRLPHEESYLRCHDHVEVAEAIREMAIRGAPAIGVAAAMAVALGMRRCVNADADERKRVLASICDVLARTRPTPSSTALTMAA